MARRFYTGGWLVILLLGLSACAAQKQLETIPTALKAGEGFVIVRIVTNSSTLDPANIINFNKWEVVKATNSAGEEKSLILDRSGMHNNSQIFAASLPAGHYKLHSIESPTFHKRIISSLIDTKIEFEVKNSQVTSMGTLIYQPTGNSGFMILPMFDDKSILETMKFAYPEIVAATSANPVLFVSKSAIGDPSAAGSNGVYIGSFSPFENLIAGMISSISDAAGATEAEQAWAKEKDQAALMRMAKDRTFSFNDVQELDSGEIIAGSNLGQILIRQPNKGWKRLDTGYPVEYTVIDVIDRKLILAGGEEGVLMYSGDTGKTWQRIKSPVKNALYLDISHYKNEFLVLSREHDDLVVNSSTDPKGGNWQELLRIKNIAEQTKYTPRIDSGSAVVHDGKYIVISPLAETQVYDLTARVWAKYPLPEAGFFRLRRHADGYIYAMRFRYPYISRDNGKTWVEHENACVRQMDIWYGPKATGYALCFQGAFTVSNSLQKQVDLKSPWQEIISEIPVLAHKIFVSDKRDFMFYVGVNGLVYVSQDGGSNWKEERRTF